MIFEALTQEFCRRTFPSVRRRVS